LAITTAHNIYILIIDWEVLHVHGYTHEDLLDKKAPPNRLESNPEKQKGLSLDSFVRSTVQ
jgi:hypothetical protein